MNLAHLRMSRFCPATIYSFRRRSKTSEFLLRVGSKILNRIVHHSMNICLPNQLIAHDVFLTVFAAFLDWAAQHTGSRRTMQNCYTVSMTRILGDKPHVSSLRDAELPTLTRSWIMLRGIIQRPIENCVKSSGAVLLASIFRQIGGDEMCEDKICVARVVERTV